MGGREPEQITADMLRVLYKHRLIDVDTLVRLIDNLQIKLFERYLKSKDQPDHLDTL